MNRTVRLAVVGVLLCAVTAGVGRPQGQGPGGEGPGFQPPLKNSPTLPLLPEPWYSYFERDVGTLIQCSRQFETNLSAVGLAWLGPRVDQVNHSAEYMVIARSECDQPLHQVVVRVRVPDGATVAETRPAIKETGGVITWELGTLPARGWRGLYLKLVTDHPGVQHPEARVTLTGSAAKCVTVVPDGAPNLRLEVVESVDPVRTGDETVYIVRVTNTGTAAETNLVLVCRLPGMMCAGVTAPAEYLERVGVDFNTPFGPIRNTSTVTFEPVRELAPGVEAVFRMRATAGRPTGTVTFKASLTTDRIKTPVTKEESTVVTER
jgi:uncharacterized repeat protein (TIGR01451 family)